MTIKPPDVKLKKCPFCGNKGCIGELEDTFYVVCCHCNAEQYPHNVLDSYGATNKWTKEEAIKAWNTRHESQPALVRLDEGEVERQIKCHIEQGTRSIGINREKLIKAMLNRQPYARYSEKEMGEWADAIIAKEKELIEYREGK